MYYFIGKKESFGIEIEISSFEPKLAGRVRLAIGSKWVGNFDEENYLYQFLRSLYRISLKHSDLWSPRFEGLDCRQIFYTIHPFFDEPDLFFDLSDEEQQALEVYDVFLMMWGENFDGCSIRTVVKDGICTFIWVTESEYLSRNADLNCVNVPLTAVQDAYKEICKIIPDSYWPSSIEKFT